MKTLYLHIGTPKTGTTSIQEFGVQNREEFTKHQYCYPETIVEKFKDISKSRNGHFLVCRIWTEEGKRDKEAERSYYERGMKVVLESFSKYDNVVLSDEHLWWATSSHRRGLWKRLKKEAKVHHFQVKLVVYLRRQDDYLCSHWNQFIKNNVNNAGWEEHVARYEEKYALRVDYASKLASIADVFGKDSIIVRRFVPDAFYGGDIYRDFLHAIGLDWSSGFSYPEEKDNNKGLKGNTCEIKRILNELPQVENWELRQMGHILKDCSRLSGKEYVYHMFSPQERRAYMQQYEEGNAYVAREYIGDGKPLFPEIDESLPKWKQDNPYMYRDLTRFMGIAYLELMRKQNQLEEQIRKLETKWEKKESVLRGVYHKWKSKRSVKGF